MNTYICNIYIQIHTSIHLYMYFKLKETTFSKNIIIL